jgi:hypothetical protein
MDDHRAKTVTRERGAAAVAERWGKGKGCED